MLGVAHQGVVGELVHRLVAVAEALRAEFWHGESTLSRTLAEDVP